MLYRPKYLHIHSYGFKERDFVVGVVIRLRDERSGVQIPIRHFSLPHNVQSVYGAHAATKSKGTGFALGAKRPGRKDNHSSPSSAEKKNEWSCASTIAACTGTNLSLNMAL
jgi:hypothetical protein